MIDSGYKCHCYVAIDLILMLLNSKRVDEGFRLRLATSHSSIQLYYGQFNHPHLPFDDDNVLFSWQLPTAPCDVYAQAFPLFQRQGR